MRSSLVVSEIKKTSALLNCTLPGCCTNGRFNVRNPDLWSIQVVDGLDCCCGSRDCKRGPFNQVRQDKVTLST